MSFPADLHYELSREGLVTEDNPLSGCSPDYYQRFMRAVSRACGDVDPDDVHDLARALSDEEEENEALSNKVDSLEADLSQALRENSDLDDYVDELKQELADLKAAQGTAAQ